MAAIKHTHHPMNTEHKGDTGKFEDAGAVPVILAGDGEAVVFTPQGTSHIAYRSPGDLLASIQADFVFVEGFKGYDGWPRFDVSAINTTAEAIALLDENTP